MERCFVLFLLLLLIACSEDPANITEEPGDSSAAPNLEVQTVKVKLLSSSFLFDDYLRKRDGELRNPPALLFPGDITWEWNNGFLAPEPGAGPFITEVGVPIQVYRVRDGHLIQEEIIPQEPLYYLLWCQLEGKKVLMNVLANRIRYIPYNEAMDQAYKNLTPAQEPREDELWAAHRAKFDALPKEVQTKLLASKAENDWKRDHKLWLEIFPELCPNNQWLREINPQPFDIRHYGGGEILPSYRADFGDEIEVVIKYSFTLEVIRRNRVGHPTVFPPVEMIFVDVKRNISRPHITFRGELFQ